MNDFTQVEKDLNLKFPVPAPLSWKVKPYGGNYDDGIYADGTCVTVGVASPIKFLWTTFRPYFVGVVVSLADPREPENIYTAAQYAYSHRSMKEKVLTSS